MKVRENVKSQLKLHLQAFPAKQNFWMELSCSDVLANIHVVAHLQNAFVDVCKACDKGKDKFLRFLIQVVGTL